MAQEKTRIWRTRQRTDAVTGKRTHGDARSRRWSTTGTSTGSTPISGRSTGNSAAIPVHRQIYLNGHEYAKRQCLKAGIGFTALDNAFGAVSDPDAVQEICDGLTDQKIYRFACKWLARLPHPFTAEDEQADYRWQLSVQQIDSPPPWRWTGPPPAGSSSSS